MPKITIIVPVCILLITSVQKLYGQQIPKPISMYDAVKIALTNSPISKNAELKVIAQRNQPGSSSEYMPTEINFANGQMYSAINDSYFEINQHFGSPMTLVQQSKYNKQATKLAEAEQKIIFKKLTAETKIDYNSCVYELSKLNTIRELNSFYNEILAKTGVPYDTTDTSLLNRNITETMFASFQNQLFQTEQDYVLACNKLHQTIYSTDNYVPIDSSLELYAIEILNSGPNKFNPTSGLELCDETVALGRKKLLVEQSKLFPEITAGYFRHSINGDKGFQGFKVGVAIPLWYFPQKARINQAKIEQEITNNSIDLHKFNLNQTINNLKIQLDKLFVDISFYRENALKLADSHMMIFHKNLVDKKLNYLELFKNLEETLKIRLNYLEKLKRYNETAIQLESFID